MRKICLIVWCVILLSAIGCVRGQDAQTHLGIGKTEAQTAQAVATAAKVTTQATQTAEADGKAMQETQIDIVGEQVAAVMSKMTVEQKIGQMIVMGYDNAQAGEDAKAIIDEVHPGGFVFTSVNFVDAVQTRKLVTDLNMFSETPLIISCTEEGGRVSRATGNDMRTTRLPAMLMIGQTGDTELAYRAGLVLGAELKSLGVNLNFAPVADIWSNPENTVIGDRSFGDDAQLVSAMVAQMVRGMREMGLGTVLKHFPGHGGTSQDSHTHMTYNYSTLAQLTSNELLPFAAGIEAGTDGVMIAHIVLPSVMQTQQPATVSQIVITQILREQLGFDGLVITDSMHMVGMTNYASVPQGSVMAVAAGADILLVGQGYAVDTFEALRQAVSSGEISMERVDSAVERILRFKYEHGLFDEEYQLPSAEQTLGIQAHIDLVEEIYRRADAQE